MALPLAHRLTHQRIYIPEEDDCWDMARINKELKEIEKGESPWKEESDHPYKRFVSGDSRFDFETVKEYVDLDKKPLMFWFRVLPLSRYNAVKTFIELSSMVMARQEAVRYSLMKVENLDGWNHNCLESGLTDEALRDLRELLGEFQYTLLGFAAVKAGQALTPSEKKL